VIATVHGWLSDTVGVTVDASRKPESTLLADRLEGFDSLTWVPFGDPAFQAIDVGGRPVLWLQADGVGLDGFRSRRSFDLSRGATFEAEYRLPLTRRDRQAFAICLSAQKDTLAGWTGHEASDVSERVCASQPSGETARFDPASFVLSGRVFAAPLLRPDLLPADDWTHLALVVAPDGHARLLINREEVAQLPYLLRLDPRARWHAKVYGRSVDTQLLVRNLVLWDGMRY
jgi:hypothetical protein